jgi:hypothetical protein
MPTVTHMDQIVVFDMVLPVDCGGCLGLGMRGVALQN